jgi:ATP-dependent helicase/nuclease subunit B
MLELFDTLTPGTVILTPNQRLSAVFIKKYNAWQMQCGNSSWLSPDILPLTSWIKRLWLEAIAQEFTPAPFLLSPEAEQIIWETILRQSPDKNLLQVTNTAELARAAWGILKLWQVDFNNPELQTTEDGVVFQRWAHEFIKICDENRWLDTSSLTAAVINRISKGSIIAPLQLILVGFTEITPVHQTLLDSCKQAHTNITVYTPERVANSVNRLSLIDENHEIHIMARWAKQLYDENPQAMIGCVVPSLEKCRARVIEIFSEVFAENRHYILDPTLLPFNISAGKSLALYPIIHMALQSLKLPKHNIPLETLSTILSSPFIVAAETEQLARAKLVASLQENNVASITLTSLINHAQDCPLLCEALNKVAKQVSSQKKHPVSYWVTHFFTCLTKFGWPGERNLNSPEYQTAETWLKLLTSFTHFERFLGPVSYHDALNFLVYLTTEQIYQPESPETTVQILGALEAADIPFDHLWVMGLDDSNWPQAPKPNPFIPQRLQRNLNLPHATAERELAFTQQLTAQLRHSAKQVIFSYASVIEDLPLRPSPLLSDIPEIQLNQLTLAVFTSPALQIFATRQLEKLHDELAPALAPDEKPRGGSSIFKNQAACPFKAFAESRLLARKQDTVTLGLRANQRGSILHKAMELIWFALSDQATLLNMAELELQNIIEHCIDEAIQHVVTGKNSTNKYYLKLEAERLYKIIYAWLILEKERPYFKIKSLEEKRSTVFGNIPINIIADRIDELADGKYVIIDYKSNKNLTTANWLGTRPEEPQLPLYCVLDPENTNAIMFALVNPVTMGWTGLSDTPLDIKGVKALSDEKNKGLSWSQQIAEWQKTLTQLAADFCQGKAKVDPKNAEQTCEHCHLPALCRINEAISL